jgi:hypothetical protein
VLFWFLNCRVVLNDRPQWRLSFTKCKWLFNISHILSNLCCIFVAVMYGSIETHHHPPSPNTPLGIWNVIVKNLQKILNGKSPCNHLSRRFYKTTNTNSWQDIIKYSKIQISNHSSHTRDWLAIFFNIQQKYSFNFNKFIISNKTSPLDHKHLDNVRPPILGPQTLRPPTLRPLTLGPPTIGPPTLAPPTPGPPTFGKWRRQPKFTGHANERRKRETF